MRDTTQQSLFFTIGLALQLLVSVLLLVLTVSINESLKDADRQRAAASKQREETLCILKVNPVDRTPDTLSTCAK